MGTSSNFGNMFSVTVAAAFLPFLPMLPSQILLNNLLYDSSQMAIPTDRVDEEQLTRPSHWDIGLIRRFMTRFGPISSVFDFATFAVMLWGFHAAAPEFRSAWFVESLATQTLIVFAIRTRRVPFFRSRPSRPLLVSALTVVTVGALLPQSALSETLGFAPLPLIVFAVLVAFVLGYLLCVEFAKHAFYKTSTHRGPTAPATRPSAPGPPARRPLEPPPSAALRRTGPLPGFSPDVERSAVSRAATAMGLAADGRDVRDVGEEIAEDEVGWAHTLELEVCAEDGGGSSSRDCAGRPRGLDEDGATAGCAPARAGWWHAGAPAGRARDDVRRGHKPENEEHATGGRRMAGSLRRLRPGGRGAS